MYPELLMLKLRNFNHLGCSSNVLKLYFTVEMLKYKCFSVLLAYKRVLYDLLNSIPDRV